MPNRFATTHTLAVPGAVITYDVYAAEGEPDGRPPLLLVGQPMDASGFATLASWLPGRTVVTYDPRGLGRSTRSDGETRNDPAQQAGDLHHLVDALGSGPVDLFGSSGGAVTGLDLVTRAPGDVRTFVAHEPPVLPVLPDADRALAAMRRAEETYRSRGWGAGMAAFVALISWQGELTDAFPAEPPDPATLGLPTDDDGTRSDPLLSGASSTVTSYRPDVAALTGASTRIVVAAGEESRDAITWRTSVALAGLLGQDVAVFPSHHTGFVGEGFGRPGRPEAFAQRLGEVLAG
ncbi:alpha/beta fold hydrolase [Cellulomonas sp. PhB143]|uniref:alpha/beta fold hydrolase n=1 Tax=Cellulomonas sp. PhB143 TaxID=2485186 RepID=UPI000F4AEF9D|nr:alpha/beta hydrolase [Cellulomonas sp. PhB143]ROS78954.1 pimeloyl-ACP methyl ester carboxylesterase [Cellulomonas sp. PhB143]